MILFKQFTYDSETSSKTLVENPTDNIDVPALLKNKPHWVSHYGQKQIKKKVLILNPSAGSLCQDRSNLVDYKRNPEYLLMTQLHRLKEAGFKIYWNNYDHLNSYSIKNDLAHVHSNSDEQALLTHAAEQLKLSRDELLILNDEAIASLIKHSQEENWHNLDNFELIDTKELNLSQQALVHLLEEKGEDIKLLDISLFSTDVLSTREIHLQNLEKLALSPSLEDIIENPNQPINKSLINKITKNGLPRLTSLDFSVALSGEDFLKILPEQGKNLKTLNITAPELDLTDLTILEQCQLDSLEKLVIDTNNKMSPALFGSLKNNKILKHLQLNEMTICRGDFPPQLSLASLEVLDLSGSVIEKETLFALLQKAPNLKKLYMPDGLILTKEDVLPLEHLEEIRFDPHQYDPGIFVKSKHARIPSIEYCIPHPKYKDHSQSLDELPEHAVLDVSLPSQNFIQELEYFSKKQKNLVKLELFNIEFWPLVLNDDQNAGLNQHTKFYNLFTEKFAYHLPCLKTLEEMSWSLKDMPKEIRNHHRLHTLSILMVLHHFMQSTCPNVKKINLKGCRMFKMARETHSGMLTFLTIEHLSYAGIGENDSHQPGALNSLLLMFPRLRHLSLTNLSLKAITPDLVDALPLLTLETLTLSKIKLPFAFLQKLHAAAPHIDIQYGDQVEILDENGLPLKLPSAFKQKEQKASTPQKQEKIDAVQFPKAPHNMLKTEFCDANTSHNPNKQFNIDKIFFARRTQNDPIVNHYRWDLFDKIEINPEICDIQHAFEQKYTQEANYQIQNDIPVVQDLFKQFKRGQDTGEYFGRMQLSLTPEWQLLPSLSSNDVMTGYGLDKDAQIKIAYDASRGQYFIRSQKAAVVQFDWTVKPAINNNINKLPEEIKKKIIEIQAFKAGSLDIESEGKTGQDYLNALSEQKLGACRHRVIVFKAWMKTHYPTIPVRIVTNDCHAFIEIQQDGKWITCDLGGYPAKLEINEKNNPGLKSNEKKVMTASLSDKGEVKTEQVVIKKKRKASRFQPAKKMSWKNPKHLMQWLVTTVKDAHKTEQEQMSKQLVYMKDDASINGFRYHMESFCKNTQRNCFYVHSKEDLICAASFLTCDTAYKGTINKGPGGPLYDFLIKARQKGDASPVLLINYDNFSAQDIVRFNALLDQTAKADGTDLPKDLKIVGMMNPNKPDAYRGSDFLSRFDNKPIDCPYTAHELKIPNIIPPIQKDLDESIERAFFYHASDWEEVLLGRWTLQAGQLVFEEGVLLKALRLGKKDLALYNAPVNNADFIRFWQQAFLTGQIKIPGHAPVNLPKEFKLSQHEAPKLQNAQAQISLQLDMPWSDTVHVLNSGSVSELMSRYVYEENSLNLKEGLLAQYANQTLKLYVSDVLPEFAWAQIIDTCKKYNTQLVLKLAPNVQLPKALGLESRSIEPQELKLFNVNATQTATSYVHTSDRDVSIYQLKQQYKQAKVIDCSEVIASDLLIKLRTHLNEETCTLTFNEEEGALLKALKNNETVILTGHL